MFLQEHIDSALTYKTYNWLEYIHQLILQLKLILMVTFSGAFAD